MTQQILFGFHAVGTRLKTAPHTVLELHYDASRCDQRMQQFLLKVREANIRLQESPADTLQRLSGTHRHQGIVAKVLPLPPRSSLDDLLDTLTSPPLLLVLDGVTDPHNLGACLRAADGAGVHAVIAPQDHAVGINATVAKVASGAAESVPYFRVTNLARTLNELKERGIWIVGTTDQASSTLYECEHLKLSLAVVLGAEGKGLRQLTQRTCDVLVKLPMYGVVESLNVSVAAGICLYEIQRQRTYTTQ